MRSNYTYTFVKSAHFEVTIDIQNEPPFDPEYAFLTHTKLMLRIW